MRSAAYRLPGVIILNQMQTKVPTIARIKTKVPTIARIMRLMGDVGSFVLFRGLFRQAPRDGTLSRCLHVVAIRRKHLNDAQATALGRQLNALLADEDELKEAGLSVSEASLDRLADFLAAHQALAHPNLSVTRNGNFAASWSPHRRRKLTLIFEPSGAGEWIAIDIDPGHPVYEKGQLPDISRQFAGWMSA
jgi:hypothetical protein